ncbi:MAG: hypothetical protein QOD63_2540 [Actinomycetota bacterium]|nr:hypothetical protein [Actinomycetota bacterium]
MATSASSGGWKSESFIGDVRELWDLVLAYLKQETIDPIKGLGRYVAYGLAGSLAIGMASILILLGILRVLQERTGGAFDGRLQFVPYLAVLLACGAVIAASLKAMSSEKRGRT